jgi:hypothetical protein
VGSDSELYDVAEVAERDEAYLDELEAFASAWTPDAHQACDAWLDRTPITESYEAAKFYFMFGLLDAVDVPMQSARVDPLAAAVADLRKMEGDSANADRRWAAQKLAELGPKAREAVPALQRATRDRIPEVRAWAHAALALITGADAEHRRAIAAILADRSLKGLDRSFAESALEELDRPADERNLRRLMGAAITNDVDTIREMAKVVDVNRSDREDNQTAITLAVGNNHPEAVRALLDAGADANQRDRFGNETLLHDAVRRRRGAAVIELLLQHGADPLLQDKDGQTPLDLARDAAWPTNIQLLEAAIARRRSEPGKQK